MSETKHITTLTATIDELPLMNAQVMEILDLIDDPDSNFKILISKLPPEVTTRFLKMANSSVYGQLVHDINHALRILGFNAMRQSLVSSLIMDRVEKELAASTFNLDKFQRQASFSTAIATMVGKTLDYEKQAELFTAAMMHNIGKLVIAAFFADKYAEIEALKETEKTPTLVAERRVLGYGHGELGGAILARFNIPEELCRAIRHHEVDIDFPADEEYQLDFILRAAVNLADRLTLPPGTEDPLELVALFEEPLAAIREEVQGKKRTEILHQGYAEVFPGLLVLACERIEALITGTAKEEQNSNPNLSSRNSE